MESKLSDDCDTIRQQAKSGQGRGLGSAKSWRDWCPARRRWIGPVGARSARLLPVWVVFEWQLLGVIIETAVCLGINNWSIRRAISPSSSPLAAAPTIPVMSRCQLFKSDTTYTEFQYFVTSVQELVAYGHRPSAIFLVCRAHNMFVLLLFE